ncbi:MAG TPA: NAD(P)/FAD-dependent oxidoreductase [Pyrinomonadaceae bacterium]|jgi:NADH dehydrogenase|nr:NAD(P)/FAD-dependent oxidoreductase [Pyrinomonadaceae bacterium]
MADKTARILIIGGGFGGIFTALELAGEGEVTLVSTEDHFLFTPMLYEYLSGEVEAWHIAPQYKELLDERIRLVRGEVTGIDLKANEASITGQSGPLAYDVLVLAVGGVTNYAGVEGADEYALPFRKIAHADRLRQRMVETLDRVAPDLAPQDARRALTFAVVGAGASGVELSTKMADLLRDAFERRALPGEPRILLIEMGAHVVPGMGDDIRAFVEDALKESRVEIHTRTRVRRVTANGLVFEHNGEQTEMEAAAVVWTGGVRMNPLVERLEVEKDRRGLLIVKPTLQLQGYEHVFALGDIAFYADASPRLAGTAQLALQEAGLVADNIKAWLGGRELRTKHFQELGEAVSLGTERAAVLAGGRAFGGALARQARFTLYTSRLPTWHHRLKVGASWFFEGTAPRPLQPLGINRS